MWFFCAFSVLAASYYVEPTEGVGTSTNQLQVTTELVKNAVSTTSGATLAPELSQADFSLRPKLMRLGSSSLLSVQKLKGKQVLHSAQLKVVRFDELDQIVIRTVRAAIEENTAEAAPRVQEVTRNEIRSPNKVGARTFAGVGLGPSWLNAVNAPSSALGFTVFYGWDIQPQISLRLLWDRSFVSGSGNDASFDLLAIGMQYFFDDHDITPFAMGSFGYAFAERQGNDSGTLSNFGGSIGGGVRFFRTSKVNVEVGLHYMLIAESFAAGTPNGLAARVALLF
jgi:hypothetical protein